jgi:holo-[acyl-carrier protein] synthase
VIVAVGTDIIELERIRGVWAREGDRFLARIYTAPERAYCLAKADPLPSLAARFAAKEAFQKCWPRPHSWQDVWVEHVGPRPTLRYAEAVAREMLERGWRAHVSLSHTHLNAVATVVLEEWP